jgi:outer membrane biosynthesis protein TonB
MTKSNSRILQAALLCAFLAAGLSGCQKRTALAAPPLVIVPAPPEPKAETAPAAEAVPKPVPENPPAPEPVAPAPEPRRSPRRARAAGESGAANPSPDSPAAPKAPAPQITPQLSPEQQADLRQHTDANIAAAQENLRKSNDRPLTNGQHDLADKIRAFLEQARSAAASGDWVRANNLSQKAHVLSVELANSL